MSRRITIATAAVVAAAALALTGCSGGSGATDASGSPSASATAAPKPGLNTPVTAGTFQFTVHSVTDAGATVGTSPLTKTAQGTFLSVDLGVANTGNKAETFLVNYVKLVDSAGKVYEADPSATLYAAGSANTWVAAINPGNSIQGPVVFDVPAGTKAASIQVTDSMFGGAQQTITVG